MPGGVPAVITEGGTAKCAPRDPAGIVTVNASESTLVAATPCATTLSSVTPVACAASHPLESHDGCDWSVRRCRTEGGGQVLHDDALEERDERGRSGLGRVVRIDHERIDDVALTNVVERDVLHDSPAVRSDFTRTLFTSEPGGAPSRA